MTIAATSPIAGTAYASPISDRRAMLEEGLACIITGRPFSSHLSPTDITRPAFASCADGIASILRGPSVE